VPVEIASSAANSGFDAIDFIGDHIRFSARRDAAPEKVNAIIKPNRANIAPSTVLIHSARLPILSSGA